MFFLSLYFQSLSMSDSSTPHETLHSVFDQLKSISSLINKFSELTSSAELDHFRQNVQSAITGSTTQWSYQSFTEFMEGMANKQDTIRFWYQFLNNDCLAYIALFLSIRYRNWELRLASLKQQAAIFSAFDRNIYERLIPQHLADVLRFPEPILRHLKNGSFSVQFTSTEWHAVALDECHEMKINKDAKLAIIRPSRERMKFLSNYMAFRARCVRNLTDQLFPDHSNTSEKFTHNPTSKDRKAHVNMQRMCGIVTDHGMFHDSTENQGLWNILAGKKATDEQSHDLLNFRTIGQQGFEQFVKRKYIKGASTNAPV